jgi:flagellar biosynthetic protein FliS
MTMLKAETYGQAGPQLLIPNSVKLLDALFVRSLKECERATESIGSGNLEGITKSLRRVSEIVEALNLALDHAVAPDLCAYIESLYLYVQDRIGAASRTLDVDAIREAAKVLLVLRDAFFEAAQTCTPEAV